MTNITFFCTENHIFKMVAEGHSEFADAGYDIICSAVSTLTQTAVLAIKKLTAVKHKYKVKNGFLSLEIDIKTTESDLFKTDLILNTIKVGIEDLSKGYKAYIKLEEKNYVY